MRYCLVLVAFLIAGCSFEPSSSTGQVQQGGIGTGSTQLDQTAVLIGKWRLVTIFDASGQLISTRFAPNVLATASLEIGADGRVSGSSGCNRIGGGYTAIASSFSLSNFFSTKKGCFGPAGDLESLVMPFLSPESTGSVSGDVLQIDHPLHGKLIYKKV